MKLLFDLLPVVIFFIVYKWQGIYPATASAIIVAGLQVVGAWVWRRRVENVQWLTLGVIVVFGGATLWLRDPIFIKWKPTILQWLFAVVFMASHFIGQKLVIQRMLGGQVELPDEIWRRLSLAWILFFLGSGAANLLVAYHYDEDTWVNFKLFGLMGMTILFVIGQSLYLVRHIQEKPSPGDG